ncbi:ATP-binding protein, partial [Galactobacter sp.]|uniref:sensor histidine kinase n=1 Tax=Galactobacter sp. TaxID=2676125 RepID=UPI0025C4473A
CMRTSARRPRTWSLARRVLLAQWIVLVIAAIVAIGGSYLQTRSTVFRSEGDSLKSIGTLAADEPEVRRAYAEADPETRTKGLSVVSRRVMADTGTDFATFLDTDGVRLTYHRPGYVGTKYSGRLAPALKQGKGFTETSSTATAGLSVRAVVPVRDADGEVVGALTVGRTVGALQLVAASTVPLTLAVVLGIAALLAVVTWWEARYLRRVTQGLGPEQMSQRFAAADAALVTVDEGIIITNADGLIVFHNRAADALLKLSTDQDRAPDGVHPDGIAPSELGLSGPLGRLIQDGESVEDQAHTIDGRVVVVRQQPLRRPLSTGSSRGWVMTVHDHTAVQRLSGELATTRSLTTALRAQNHDHSNRLHTLLSLMEIGHVTEAHAMLRSSVGFPAGSPDQDGVDGDVVLTALLHGKVSEAAERGIDLETDVRLERGTGLPPEDVVAIFGNLVDNAIDAAQDAEQTEGRWVRVEVSVEEPADDADQDRPWLIASVSDGGPGIAQGLEEKIFAPGFSTKPADAVGRGQGLPIVASVCARLGGTVAAATDSGTVFTVEVPLPRQEETSPSGTARTGATPPEQETKEGQT